MPGLTFLNLAFLVGLAAAAVPILIHLFSRRRSTRQEWASVQFLKELYSQRVRRVRLRQLFLLLVRVAAIVLFALAMMRPALTGTFLASGRAPSTVCLVIDTSYSMHTAQGGQPTFEGARVRALEIAELLGSGDEVYVIAASDRAENATPYPMQDLGQVRETIETLEPSERAGDLRAGIEMAARLLRASKNINREMYVISDMQAQGWAALADSSGVAVDLPEDAAVCVVGAGGAERPNNVAVRDVRAYRQLTGGGNLQIEVTLSNYSDEELGSVPIDAKLDGATVAQTFVDLSPSSTVRTLLNVAGGEWQRGWGRVSIPEDILSLDDQRFFVLGDEQRVRIGVVADGETSSRRAANFLRLALEPEPEAGPFAARVIEADRITASAIADLQVLIIAGVARLEHGSVELLKAFVRDGGALLIFPGDRSDLRFYNDQLLSPFLPVKIAAVVDAEPERAFRLTPVVPGHPIFAGFRASTSERLTRARFQKVIKVVPGEARVLARFRGDLPALIEGERVLLFGSSVDRRWNDFPTSGAFVPLVHQAVAYLAGTVDGGRQATVGATIERLAALPDARSRLRSLGPAGDDVPFEAVERGGDLLIRIPATARAGIYAVVDQGGDDLVAVAVNVDAREGDLSPVDLQVVERLFEGHPFSYITGAGNIETSIRQARYGRELWRFVLLLALVVLVVEVFLSRGRGAFTPAAS